MRAIYLAAFVAALAAGSAASPAFAASCDEQANAKGLSGGSRASFVQACRQQPRPMGKDECGALADSKQIEDGAKATFIRECVAAARKAAAGK